MLIHIFCSIFRIQEMHAKSAISVSCTIIPIDNSEAPYRTHYPRNKSVGSKSEK